MESIELTDSGRGGECVEGDSKSVESKCPLYIFLGLPDLDLDPLVRGMDPDPDPSIIMQK